MWLIGRGSPGRGVRWIRLSRGDVIGAFPVGQSEAETWSALCGNGLCSTKRCRVRRNLAVFGNDASSGAVSGKGGVEIPAMLPV